jgi:hypothetical protein
VCQSSVSIQNDILALFNNIMRFLSIQLTVALVLCNKQAVVIAVQSAHTIRPGRKPTPMRASASDPRPVNLVRLLLLPSILASPLKGGALSPIAAQLPLAPQRTNQKLEQSQAFILRQLNHDGSRGTVCNVPQRHNHRVTDRSVRRAFFLCDNHQIME